MIKIVIIITPRDFKIPLNLYKRIYDALLVKPCIYEVLIKQGAKNRSIKLIR